MPNAVLSLSRYRTDKSIAETIAEPAQTEGNAESGIYRKRRKQMGKPKMIGMNKPYIPNAKADAKRGNPFGKKGKGKK